MTTPYYSDEAVTLYHGDARELTQWLEGDVLITDPPYGMGFVSNAGVSSFGPIAGDESTQVRDTILELWGNKPAAVFGTWKAPRPSGIVNMLIWDKTDFVGPGMGDLRSPWGFSHEEIYILGEWRKQGLRRGSVIRTKIQVRALSEKVNHPTPKPGDILEQLILQAPEGILVDPFAGSGSLLVTAKTCGRQAIGVEIDERYCEIVARRCAQGSLWHV